MADQFRQDLVALVPRLRRFAYGLTGNRQLFYKDAPPFANLQLTVIGRMGVPVEHFGNSTGTLNVLTGV